MKLLEIVRGARHEQARSIATSLKLGEEAQQGRRRRRQLLRLRRQPHARLLHARGVPAARRRRQRVADRQGADGFRPAGRPVRHAGHRRHRRRRAHPPVPEVDRQDARGRTAVGGAGSPLRDGPLRAEDRAGWYKLRARQPHAHPGSGRRRDRRGRGGASAASRGGRLPTTRSSRASRRRSPTRARGCSRRATPSAPATST